MRRYFQHGNSLPAGELEPGRGARDSQSREEGGLTKPRQASLSEYVRDGLEDDEESLHVHGRFTGRKDCNCRLAALSAQVLCCPACTTRRLRGNKNCPGLGWLSQAGACHTPGRGRGSDVNCPTEPINITRPYLQYEISFYHNDDDI